MIILVLHEIVKVVEVEIIIIEWLHIRWRFLRTFHIILAFGRIWSAHIEVEHVSGICLILLTRWSTKITKVIESIAWWRIRHLFFLDLDKWFLSGLNDIIIYLWHALFWLNLLWLFKTVEIEAKIIVLVLVYLCAKHFLILKVLKFIRIIHILCLFDRLWSKIEVLELIRNRVLFQFFGFIYMSLELWFWLSLNDFLLLFELVFPGTLKYRLFHFTLLFDLFVDYNYGIWEDFYVAEYFLQQRLLIWNVLLHVLGHQFFYALFSKSFGFRKFLFHRDNLHNILAQLIISHSFLFFYILFGLLWSVLNGLHFLLERRNSCFFGRRHFIWCSILLLLIHLKGWYAWPRRHGWLCDRGTRRLNHVVRLASSLSSALSLHLFLFESRREFDSFINKFCVDWVKCFFFTQLHGRRRNCVIICILVWYERECPFFNTVEQNDQEIGRILAILLIRSEHSFASGQQSLRTFLIRIIIKLSQNLQPIKYLCLHIPIQIWVLFHYDLVEEF